MVDSLSEDDFRKALYESLSKKGIVSSFKSHLRQQIALQLSGKAKSDVDNAPGSELVGDMLTAAHLKFSKYEYSLSTFLSEANVSVKGLNIVEWLRLLNVAEDSSLARVLNNEDKAARSPLLSFVEAVVKTCGRGVENAGIQTEAVTLQDKLDQLDEKYSNLPANHFLSPQDVQLQNIYNDNKNVQELVKLEVERFKELELERYKLLERDRVNKQFNKKLADFESEYRQRLDTLHKREVESAKSHDKMKAETEGALFKERQSLLSELESLRSRSHQMEREHDLTKNQVSLEREKLAILSARLEEREEGIAQKEGDFKNKLQEHQEKARLQCKAELRDREATISAKENQIKEELEERDRISSALEAHHEELKTLRRDNCDLNDRLVLQEAQLDAARSQVLHYEAKLAVTSDYQQIKNAAVSLETERKHLLESFEKERSLSQRSERQLQDIIASLRDQLSRPSQSEADAVNELTKFKHKHFKEVEDFKNQIRQVHTELEREQKGRVSAQTELRDQFLECRAHHTVTQTRSHGTELPDFLKKYLSSVRLDEDEAPEEDTSDQSNHVLSEISSSSDSILHPTKSIVANSRKLFAQLEQEERELEREFANFRNTRSAEFPATAQFLGMEQLRGAAVPAVLQRGDKTVKFKTSVDQVPESKVAALPESKPQLDPTPSPRTTTPIPEPTDQSTQSTLTPPRGSGAPERAGQESDIMANLDPVMQQYLNRVMESKKGSEAVEPTVENTSNIEQVEQVEFDKTDSDFSW